MKAGFICLYVLNEVSMIDVIFEMSIHNFLFTNKNIIINIIIKINS